MNIRHYVTSALLLLGTLTAHAFPIALPGTEGFKVFASSTDNIIATYEGNSASYSNNLYLEGFGFVFNNHGSAVGSTVDLGSFATGTELVFRLEVTNTGYSYYTGEGARNPDGYAHARVQSDWEPNTTLVSFEDLYNGPFDFNDLSFSFTNTQGSVEQPAVPDHLSSGGALAAMFAGLALLARRRR